MKTTAILLVFGWIAWFIGMGYISDYVISRPMNGYLQTTILVSYIAILALLVRKTYTYFINNF
jgi:hypothetical protein